MASINNNQLQQIESRIDAKIIHSGDDPVRTQKFKDTVLAVYEIIEKKMYKETNMNIESYFKTHWNISRAQAYRLYNCGAIVRELADMEIMPSRERYCRILKKITKSPADLRMLWSEVIKRVDKNESLITSSLITSVWNSLMVKRNDLDRLVTNNGDLLPKSPTQQKQQMKLGSASSDGSMNDRSAMYANVPMGQHYPMTPPKSSEYSSPRGHQQHRRTNVESPNAQYHPYGYSGRQSFLLNISQQQQQQQHNGSRPSSVPSNEIYEKLVSTHTAISAPVSSKLQPQGDVKFATPKSPASANSYNYQQNYRKSRQSLQLNFPLNSDGSNTASPSQTHSANSANEFAEDRYRSFSISTQSTSSPQREDLASKRSSIASFQYANNGHRQSIDGEFNSQFQNTRLQELNKSFTGGYGNFIQRRSVDMGITTNGIKEYLSSVSKLASETKRSPNSVSDSLHSLTNAALTIENMIYNNNDSSTDSKHTSPVAPIAEEKKEENTFVTVIDHVTQAEGDDKNKINYLLNN